jgi:hypothetical protein
MLDDGCHLARLVAQEFLGDHAVHDSDRDGPRESEKDGTADISKQQTVSGEIVSHRQHRYSDYPLGAAFSREILNSLRELQRLQSIRAVLPATA